MKYLIKKILREQVSEKENRSGFEEFYSLLEKNYSKSIPEFEEFVSDLEKDIKKSPTPKITITEKGNFCGMSHSDNVILEKTIFRYSVHRFIYVLFHEIAHQYQYKKYGKNLVYNMLHQEIDGKLLDKLIEIEQVADRFGESMANKYSTKYKLGRSLIYSPYSKGNEESAKESYKGLFLKLQNELKDGTITCLEQMESRMLEMMSRTIETLPTNRYTGSTYQDNYSRYYDYSRDYDRGYGDYYRPTKKDTVTDHNDLTDEMESKIRHSLDELKTSISEEINDIVETIYNTYGSQGANLAIDEINNNGFIDFHYNFKEDENSDNFEKMDADTLIDLEDEIVDIVDTLNEIVYDSINDIADNMVQMYGWESETMVYTIAEEYGFNKFLEF